MLQTAHPPDVLELNPQGNLNHRHLERAAIFGILLIAAGLRLWRLDQNGFGNLYYAAAARSMQVSWSNFFFGSFDPLGVVTVDKPPVAIWIQAVSVKLLGFNGVSVLLPQALLGIASVYLSYHLVRRVFGVAAGMLAGLAMAIMPICVATDRDNLPDTALAFFLLLAFWAMSRAVETGRLTSLLLAMAIVGVAFNVKMLAAFVVLPTFFVAYLWAAPHGWRTRLWQLSAATIVLFMVSLSWSIVVELTPKNHRPYIGGSMNNSALDLALGYNGVARITGMGGFGPPRSQQRAAGLASEPQQLGVPLENSNRFSGPPPDTSTMTAGTRRSDESTLAGGLALRNAPGGRFRGGMPGFGGQPGLLRFSNPELAGLVTWLIPVALLGGGLAAVRLGRPRPITAQQVAILLWAGWLATHWIVFSFAQGIFHDYYVTILGPAAAALFGIGFVTLWNDSRRGGWHTAWLIAAIVLTVAWDSFIVSSFPNWRDWLLPLLLTASAISLVGLLSTKYVAARWPSVVWARLSAAGCIATILLCPAIWSFTPLLVKGNPVFPTAGPSLVSQGNSASPTPPSPPFEADSARTKKLVGFLGANRQGERILVASMESLSAAPIIIESGEPAVSLGGFMGMDRAVSKDQFIAMVKQSELRFVLLGGGPGGPPPGGFPPDGPGGVPQFAPGMPAPPNGVPFPPSGRPGRGGANAEILAWVREHGEVVNSKLWAIDEPVRPLGDEDEFAPRMRSRGFPQAQLYDCRPEKGLIDSTGR